VPKDKDGSVLCVRRFLFVGKNGELTQKKTAIFRIFRSEVPVGPVFRGWKACADGIFEDIEKSSERSESSDRRNQEGLHGGPDK